MRYGSVCSGIEAASVAWRPIGWDAAWFSEIAAFPSKVLAHHYPEIQNHGSLVGLANRLTGSARGIDLLVGGTPCQSFSVAGLRGGLDDARGNLALEFMRLADALRPRWVLWENVPGVLSSSGGRDFGSILGALAELGYGFAYRVLDAQFFGVPQRRRRVFLVGHLGDWRAAAAVLFERESVRRNTPSRRKAGKDVAHALRASFGGRGSDDPDRLTFIPEVADTLRSASTSLAAHGKLNGSDRMTLIPEPTQITSPGNRSSARPPHVAIGFNARQDPVFSEGAVGALDTDPSTQAVCVGADAWRVRRLTPRECERLQGFPDDYTAIPGAADGPRYAALGNSMAVPVMRWIGERIARVDAIVRR